MEPIEEARHLVACDWLVTRRWNRLHFAHLTDEQLSDMYWDTWLLGPVRLACGRTASQVSVPGVFTRLSARRCIGCCQALGYPPGTGSPKNDDTCRALLGLEIDYLIPPGPTEHVRSTP